MKRNFTILPVLACLVFALNITPAKSQVVSQLTSQCSFNMVPTLISGVLNQVNAKYRFTNVRTGVDAIVTVLSATNGATIDIFDDNTVSKPEAFSPQIKVPGNKTGLVEFKIEFVTTLTLLPITMDSLFATAIDIDGNSSLKEIDVIDLGGGTSSYMFGTPEISVTQSGTAFTGKNITGNEYSGIDTSARQVMFTVKNAGVTSFIYKCGAQNTSSSSASRQKSIYFKNFTYPVYSAPLPVKYSSFDAVVADSKTVNVKWVTNFEQNNDHFELERSFDNSSFKTIAVVLDGLTTGADQKTYMYKDNSQELQGQTVAYYRLKQVDIDGKISYSKVLAVRLQANKTDVSMQVSPNPFVENLTVRFTATEKANAEIRIINAAGQVMLSKQSTISKGYNNFQVDGLSRLSTGLYVAQLIVNGTVIDSQKVIKN